MSSHQRACVLSFRYDLIEKTSCRLQLCQLANVVYYDAIGFMEGEQGMERKGAQRQINEIVMASSPVGHILARQTETSEFGTEGLLQDHARRQVAYA